jgi:hypothetical protein
LNYVKSQAIQGTFWCCQKKYQPIQFAGEFRWTYNVFNEEDKRKLSFYASRNKGLSQWIASPPSVPMEAWPRALAAARTTSSGTVYRVLQALGNSVGPVDGKRKRTIPYSPS